MRTQQWFLAACSFVSLNSFIACRDGAETPTATTLPATTLAITSSGATAAVGYELLVKESLLYWRGRPVVGSGHEGILKLTSGDLAGDELLEFGLGFGAAGRGWRLRHAARQSDGSEKERNCAHGMIPRLEVVHP